MTLPDASHDATPAPFEPRLGWLVALAVFLAAALTLCWPMLAGQLINGSDYYLAGWGFRHFGAEYFRQHHSIPQWNPYIFGGLPYVAAAHGDVFYPTAWLRWVLPLDVATNLTFGGHLVLAGVTMYAFLRGLRLSWAAAVTGGLAYELTGIVASMVHPGHDGKLFVSAVAPLVFLGLLRGIRDRRLSGYGLAGLGIGLAFHGHPQGGYYLLFAAGMWSLFLIFGWTGGPAGTDRYRALAWSAAAAALGIGIYAIQLLPLFDYAPYSPRAAGGPSTGWEYATGYAFPPAELFTTFFPQLNGMNDAYAGTNHFKLHTEHLGVVVLLLAFCGLGGAARRRERIALGTIGVFFLLLSFGGHTPFYRIWYEVMPTQKNVRAVGQAFYLPALVVAAFAAMGIERLLAGAIAARRVMLAGGIFALLGLLGAAGALGGLAQSLADPQLVQQAVQNGPSIQEGGIRLLVFAVAGALLLAALTTPRLRTGAVMAGILAVLVGDLWSIDRRYFVYGDAERLFGGDAITAAIGKVAMPTRIWDGRGLANDISAYPGSWLMGRDVSQLLGYHGNELARFDELMGGKNEWRNQVSVPLLDLFAVRFITLRDTLRVPGYHHALGPVPVAPGGTAVLLEADTAPPYARLMAGAVKAPAAQTAEIAANARFPVLQVAIYPDDAPVTPTDLGGALPAAPTATAAVTAWEPGRMRIGITGRDERPLYLVVAENWYKDWQVTVDGKPAPLLRAQHTLLSAVIPPGTKEVEFTFRSKTYERGKAISLLSLLGVTLLLVAPALRRRTAPDA